MLFLNSIFVHFYNIESVHVLLNNSMLSQLDLIATPGGLTLGEKLTHFYFGYIDESLLHNMLHDLFTRRTLLTLLLRRSTPPTPNEIDEQISLECAKKHMRSLKIYDYDAVNSLELRLVRSLRAIKMYATGLTRLRDMFIELVNAWSHLTNKSQAIPVASPCYIAFVRMQNCTLSNMSQCTQCCRRAHRLCLDIDDLLLANVDEFWTMHISKLFFLLFFLFYYASHNWIHFNNFNSEIMQILSFDIVHSLNLTLIFEKIADEMRQSVQRASNGINNNYNKIFDSNGENMRDATRQLFAKCGRQLQLMLTIDKIGLRHQPFRIELNELRTHGLRFASLLQSNDDFFAKHLAGNFWQHAFESDCDSVLSQKIGEDRDNRNAPKCGAEDETKTNRTTTGEGSVEFVCARQIRSMQSFIENAQKELRIDIANSSPTSAHSTSRKSPKNDDDDDDDYDYYFYDDEISYDDDDDDDKGEDNDESDEYTLENDYALSRERLLSSSDSSNKTTIQFVEFKNKTIHKTQLLTNALSDATNQFNRASVTSWLFSSFLLLTQVNILCVMI